MSAHETLTSELRAEVLRLEDDLRARVTALPHVHDAWHVEYDAARAAKRTAAAWESWVDERVTLAAVAWVLTTVFIRFCEDNALVKPVWISGPRHRGAIDAQQQFLRETARTNADVTDREWLLQAVEYLKTLPATAGLVDDTSPMWLVTPSGDAATRLLSFWRERDESGLLVRDFADPHLDTRFLGDLYQEISEDAKKRYALLQTPVFVEEFILDRTLEPALNERPLEGFKLIDPTCGSGHFLLGAFQRLLDRWHRLAPALDERERVQAALDSVSGVDINPFAVAVARFRLTVAALQACGLVSLEAAPAFKYHLGVGDSLLHGLNQQEFDLGTEFIVDRVAGDFAYGTENLDLLRTILRNGQYDVVVGNPPYITVADGSLNSLYRTMYGYCKGTYSLSVPFMERFFMLARGGDSPGWVGQITSNSFMKRGFGKPLVEKYLPTRDLRFVIDSEGAWMPGHNMDGTPTVILIGINRRPSTHQVRAVLSMGKREGSSDIDGKGPYWSRIVEHLDEPEYMDDWISVRDLPRSDLATHPWTLVGGGALELKRALERSARRVRDVAAMPIGRAVRIGADDAFVREIRRDDEQPDYIKPYLLGEDVRDWTSVPSKRVVYPYDMHTGMLRDDGAIESMLWALRTNLAGRSTFQGNMADAGRAWWEYMQHTASAYATDYGINFANVASHNHFSLGRGGVVFNAHAPVIKLPTSATEDDYLGLLAVLNSSVSCFMIRANSQPKGGAANIKWSRTYEITGGTIADLPLPEVLPTSRAATLQQLAEALVHTSADAVVGRGALARHELDDASEEWARLRRRMVSHQEELDWEVYRLFGLLDVDLTYHDADLPDLSPGERAFELSMARKLADDEADASWFERQAIVPRADVSPTWPEAYAALVRRRIETIASNPALAVLESPENKRRWAHDGWEKTEARAVRRWILDALERSDFWLDRQGRPTPKSVAVLADDVSRDPMLVSALSVWSGQKDVDVAGALERVIESESVPYLAALRNRESGLRKRDAWNATWVAQRSQDAGRAESPNAPVAVPPEFKDVDFVRSEFWRLRGKFDQPAERFVAYIGAGREGDPSTVVGWAGWDYAQAALALATLIQSGEQQGWVEDRLIPLVAGLSEVLPWVEQWHSDPDPLYGGSSPAEFFAGLLDSYMAKLSATRESLAAWRPPAAKRGRKARA